MKRELLLILTMTMVALTSCVKERKVVLLATNDLHGAFMPYDYVRGDSVTSLSNVKNYADTMRALYGRGSVMLIDCGDHLQGDNGVYYSNYVDTLRPHIFPRVASFVGYDAVVVGNHDLEAGHAVYDRVREEMRMPYLAANALNTEDGKSYFDRYTMIRRGGLSIAVIGFTNPNVGKWISADKYSGMEFEQISRMVQSLVFEVKEKRKPDITVLALHSGLGESGADDIENCARFVASQVRGIDIVLAAHDHKRAVEKIFNGVDSVLVMEAGSRAANLSHIEINLKMRMGKVLKKSISGKVVDLSGVCSSPSYNREFASFYDEVVRFSNRKIGINAAPMDMDYNMGRLSPYMALIHLVQLSQKGVEISISAPLRGSGRIEAGDILFNDLFTLYPYENTLYIVKMTGDQIKRYLEAAFDRRLKGDDRLYNYDSATGLNYTVSASASMGERVNITAMADGTPFDLQRLYSVAMTSYRANGAGGLLQEAGIAPFQAGAKDVTVGPDIRELVREYIENQSVLYPDKIYADKKLGSWKIIE